MQTRRPPIWLAGCTAAWGLLLAPAMVEAFYAGRVFEGGPASAPEWATVGLWAAFPAILVVSIVGMWRLRRRHPAAATVMSVMPLVDLALVATLVVVLR